MLSSVFAFAPTETELRDTIAALRFADPDDCVRPSEHELLVYLRSLDGVPTDELRTRIATEYAELFVGPRPPLAPPYESLYLGYPQRLFSETTAQVRAFYERCGWTVQRRNRIPDDSIAFELEFLARLCEQEYAALDGEDSAAAKALADDERVFIATHIGQWAGSFADRIAAAWCADYYAAWSRFVVAFLTEDATYLQPPAAGPTCSAQLCTAMDVASKSPSAAGAACCARPASDRGENS